VLILRNLSKLFLKSFIDLVNKYLTQIVILKRPDPLDLNSVEHSLSLLFDIISIYSYNLFNYYSLFINSY